MLITYRKAKIKFAPFNYTIEFVFTNNVVKYARRAGWQDRQDDSTTNAVCLHFPGMLKSIIVYPKNAKMGTIVHEAWHAIRHMLSEVGAGLDNEVVAYHLGYLVQAITDFKKAKMKKKAKETLCHQQ